MAFTIVDNTWKTLWVFKNNQVFFLTSHCGFNMLNMDVYQINLPINGFIAFISFVNREQPLWFRK